MRVTVGSNLPRTQKLERSSVIDSFPAPRASSLSILACPVCRVALEREGPTYHCANAHTFDIAKQGYVNLLLAQARKSKDPGYSKTMIASRHAFFNDGHYEPLADALADIALGHVLPTQPQPVIIDAGCGEGYYLRRLGLRAAHHATLQTAHESPAATLPQRCGIDISKHGVQIAARLDPHGTYAVASTHDLPLLPAIADVLITHFSPRFGASFGRVVRPSGVVLVGSPGPQHLYELKQLVYNTPEPHDVAVPFADESDRLTLIDTCAITYPLALRDGAAISNLLAMTPLYWSASPDTQAELATLDSLDTTVDVVVHAFRVEASGAL